MKLYYDSLLKYIEEILKDDYFENSEENSK